jgi:hypothetical protein
MKHVGNLYIFLLLLGAMVSCIHSPERKVTRAFYYWKTVYKPTPYEQQRLSELNAQRTYLRLCDMDWNHQTSEPYPLAVVRIPGVIPSNQAIVPVVFVTQATLNNIAKNKVTDLSLRIASIIQTICTEASINPTEVQIDCDWTSTNKDTYFALLRALKLHPYMAGKLLSCTIRMHQIKYTTSSGIPPADRGLLMCYNMGNTRKTGNHNSILDTKTAQQYLSGIGSYPLPLDVALPLFSWTLQFREARFVGILRDVSPEMVRNSNLFEVKNKNEYACLKDTTWNGYELRTGDRLRTEAVSPPDLEKIAAYTAKRLKNTEVNIIFFSSDSLTLSKYLTNELETVYNTYL